MNRRTPPVFPLIAFTALLVGAAACDGDGAAGTPDCGAPGVCGTDAGACACDVDGACSAGCACDPDCAACAPTPHAATRCEGGDRYWFDGCGTREELAESCGGRGCAGDACTAVWGCLPGDFGDGLICHCGCGLPDPDCADPDRYVSGCTSGEVCSAAGACTRCGNGALDADEECDPALATTGDCAVFGYAPGPAPCAATCRFDYAQCRTLATCGNGALDPGEKCDGAILEAGLGCADYGFAAGALRCTAACGVDPSGCSTCGDGVRQAGEGCDDHNGAAGDGCAPDCTVETGWACSGAPSTCAPICGDGLVIAAEACDDGGRSDGDGCSASCQVETDCHCAGAPSACACLHVQTIATNGQYVNFETASLVLDGAGTPHVAYVYVNGYTDPGTGYPMDHVYLHYARPSGTSWTTSLVETWNQTQAAIAPEYLTSADDAGTPRIFYHRLYAAGGTFASATLSGGTFQRAYANPWWVTDVAFANGTWHAITADAVSGPIHSLAGLPPAAWVRDETSFGTSYTLDDTLRIAAASDGTPSIASLRSPYGHASYTVAVRRRDGANSWSERFTHTETAPAAGSVCPAGLELLALPGGRVGLLHDGFDSAGRRWLRYHGEDAGGGFTTEDVADLSWLPYGSCQASSSSHANIWRASTVDGSGRPHFIYQGQPYTGYPTIDDHYRDGAGWHVRTLPLPEAAPRAAAVDAAGALHLVLQRPNGASLPTLVYVKVDAGW